MKYWIKYMLFSSIFALQQYESKSQQKQPNVIFVIADDLGIGDLGTYGQNKIETPNYRSDG